MNIQLYACFPNKTRFDFAQELMELPTLFLLTAGRFEYTIGERTHILEAGELVFSPADVVFARRVIEPIALRVLKATELPFPADSPFQRRITPRMAEDFARIDPFGFCAGDLPASVRHYGADILWEVAHSEVPPDRPRARLREILADMNRNPAADYTNDVLCRRLNCCESSLIAQFRAETGQTPQQYLLTLRLRVGRALLIQTDRSVQEIAAECGFADPLYFSRIFSRRFGESPRVFRTENRI